jgi:hypothetical protein
VRSGTHLYARSDIVWHGTSHIHAELEPSEEVSAGRPALIGFALYTHQDDLANAQMRAFLQGRACDAASFADGVWTIPPPTDPKRRKAAGQQAEAAKRYAAQP